MGHGLPGLPGGSAWGCGAGKGTGLRAGEAAKGCSQWVSPALAAAAHPDADSLVMLAYNSVLLFRGRTGTWGNCYCRVREVTKSQQSKGTCPGAVLVEANTSLVQNSPTLFSPLASSPFSHPLHSVIEKLPL